MTAADPTTAQPATPGLDPDAVERELDIRVRDGASYNPRAWVALQIADRLVAEVRRLRGELDAAPAAPRTYALPAELRGDGPCGDCGTVDNIVWFTESVFWNRVMRRPDGSDEAGGIVCIPCFVKRVHAAGLFPTGWRLLPEFHWETAAEYGARRGPLSTVPPAGTPEGGEH